MDKKILTSIQRRLLTEQENIAKEDPLDLDLGPKPKQKGQKPKQKAPEPGAETIKVGGAEEGAGAEAGGDLGDLGGGDQGGGHSSDPAHKVEKSIEAIQQLQDAAVAMEAARFVLMNEYNDFTLATTLEDLKAQLVHIISKAKRHVMKSASDSPEAENLIASWLKS